MSSTGNFIVTWAGQGAGDLSGVYGHLFNALGTSKSADFQINTTTDGAQSTPDVAADSAGNFTVNLDQQRQDPGRQLFERRRPTLQRRGHRPEQRIPRQQLHHQCANTILPWPWTPVVIRRGYTSMGQDGSNYGVYARRYNKAGSPRERVLVNQVTRACIATAVAMDDSGKFVVTWSTYGQDNYDKLGPGDTTPLDYGIYARIFNADGTAYKYDLNGDGTAEATGELRINATTSGDKSRRPRAWTPTATWSLAGWPGRFRATASLRGPSCSIPAPIWRRQL